MFNRTDAKRLGSHLGASVVFSKPELERTGDAYVQAALRNSVMGVLDELTRKYKRRIISAGLDLLSVEYRLEAFVYTREEVDELFAQAYNAGVHDGARWGSSLIPASMPGEGEKA